jgi:hypothetical protein
MKAMRLGDFLDILRRHWGVQTVDKFDWNSDEPFRIFGPPTDANPRGGSIRLTNRSDDELITVEEMLMVFAHLGIVASLFWKIVESKQLEQPRGRRAEGR